MRTVDGFGCLRVDRNRVSAKPRTVVAKKDFVRHCTDWHGVDGKGNGPATQIVPGIAPGDLTLLSKNHDGKFPRQEVSDVIDGRKRLPNHYDSTPTCPYGIDLPARGARVQHGSRRKGKGAHLRVG